MLTCL
jgi:hypothetical protein